MKGRKVPLAKMKGIYNRDKVEAMGDKTALFYSIRCTLLVNWASSLPRTHVESDWAKAGAKWYLLCHVHKPIVLCGLSKTLPCPKTAPGGVILTVRSANW